VSLVRTIAPSELPVSLEDAKLDLRVTGDHDDANILAHIERAVSQLDGAQGWLNGRAIVTQTWAMGIQGFPDRGICLSLTPVQSVTSINYIDQDGAEQTVDAEDYRLLNANDPLRRARVVPGNGTGWPSARNEEESVTVTYVAGFGGQNAVPPYVKALVLKIVQESWAQGAPVQLANFMRTPAFNGLMELSRAPVLP
jgi:uncharacterized phiE125 gp8 family phage protein